jgi:hypothetical protein
MFIYLKWSLLTDSPLTITRVIYPIQPSHGVIIKCTFNQTEFKSEVTNLLNTNC